MAAAARTAACVRIVAAAGVGIRAGDRVRLMLVSTAQIPTNTSRGHSPVIMRVTLRKGFAQ